MKQLITFIIFVALSSNTLACSCGGYDIEKVFETSQYVFLGRVNSISSREVTIESKSTLYEINFTEVEFEVIKSYKSKLGNKLIVFTSLAACGYSFQKNRKYIVYANIGSKEQEEIAFGIAGRPMVYSCGPTRQYNENEEHYEEKQGDYF